MSAPRVDMPGVVEFLGAIPPHVTIRLENGWTITVAGLSVEEVRTWPLFDDVRVRIDVFEKPEASK